MYEGKPLILLIGASDTGRTPMAAGLLRRALGAGVVVRTAGVLSHEGEGAMPEAQMAIEQLGIDISRHLSRPLRHEEHRNAEMLLAIDRGTELVLFSDFPNDDRVACLPVLANLPDVLDPHRMPLGVWVAALRQLNDQVTAALPSIREQLGIADQEPLPLLPRKVERRRSSLSHEPIVLGSNHKMNWDHDDDMQRLLRLISGEEQAETSDQQPAETEAPVVEQLAPDAAPPEEAPTPPDEPEPTVVWPVVVAAPHKQTKAKLETWSFAATAPAINSWEPASATPEPPAAPAQADPVQPMAQTLPEGDRATHVTRMIKMLQTAEDLPEVVDWARLRHELVLRLRAIAQQGAGPLDFSSAATLMLEGKLTQQATQPSADALFMLRRSIQRLETPLNAPALATIGGELAEW